MDVWIGGICVISGRIFPLNSNVHDSINDVLMPVDDNHSDAGVCYVFSEHPTGTPLRRDVTFEEIEGPLYATLCKRLTHFEIREACAAVSDGTFLSGLPLPLREDRQVAGFAVRLDAINLQAVPPTLMDDACFVNSLLGFVQAARLAQCISDRLKAHLPLVHQLLRRDPMTIQYLRIDINQALTVNAAIYEFLPWKLRTQFAELALLHSVQNAKHIPECVWTKKRFVQRTLRTWPNLYRYVPKHLLFQRDVAALGIRANIYLWSSLPRNLKTDASFVCNVVRKLPTSELSALATMLPLSMRDNAKVARALLNRDRNLQQFLSARRRT